MRVTPPTPQRHFENELRKCVPRSLGHCVCYMVGTQGVVMALIGKAVTARQMGKLRSGEGKELAQGNSACK